MQPFMRSLLEKRSIFLNYKKEDFEDGENMQKWEYKTLHRTLTFQGDVDNFQIEDVDEPMETTLNGLAKYGWELVMVIPRSKLSFFNRVSYVTDEMWVFKREKKRINFLKK